MQVRDHPKGRLLAVQTRYRLAHLPFELANGSKSLGRGVAYGAIFVAGGLLKGRNSCLRSRFEASERLGSHLTRLRPRIAQTRNKHGHDFGSSIRRLRIDLR